MNFDFYPGEDFYSDGDIEDTIKNIVERDPACEDPASYSDEYAVVYHLSDLRENIISWFPFKGTDSVLEIGAGCGAITGALCRNAGSVTAVELSKRRAEINYLRHKEADNLKIMVGNLNDMTFDAPFDYVVVNGVLEYAMSFTEGEKPYVTFINNLKKFLKKDGHLIIAIENRLGVKYLNGAPEDHTKDFFLGINEYAGNTSVRTFSKAELSSLLDDCGLTQKEFFYPYPDYKFPTEIFSERTVNTRHYGRLCHQFGDERYYLYDEQKLMNSLRAEGIMDRFANSFLVVAGAGDEDSRDYSAIDYVKFSNDRAERFRIYTVIGRELSTGKGENADADMHVGAKFGTCTDMSGSVSGEMYVEKRMASPAAAAHIEHIFEAEGGYNSSLCGIRTRDGIRYPFLKYETMDAGLLDLFTKGDVSGFKAEADRCFDVFFRDAVTMGYVNEAFETVFGKVTDDEPAEGEILDGKPSDVKVADGELSDGETSGGRYLYPDTAVCVTPANIDLIFDNIFITEDGYKVIDGEWIFNFPVPVDFIIWRALNEFYNQHRAECVKVMDYMELLSLWNLGDTEERVFRSWADHFAVKYVGCNRIAKFIQKANGFDLNLFHRNNVENRDIKTRLFIDDGSGYSEENVIDTYLCPDADGNFSVTFDIDRDRFPVVKELRWDPCEGRICEVSISSLSGCDGICRTNGTTSGKDGVLWTNGECGSSTNDGDCVNASDGGDHRSESNENVGAIANIKFGTTDPQVIFRVPAYGTSDGTASDNQNADQSADDVWRVEISGNISTLSTDESAAFLNNELDRMRGEYEDALNNLSAELHSVKQETTQTINTLNAELDCIKSSKWWRAIKKVKPDYCE